MRTFGVDIGGSDLNDSKTDEYFDEDLEGIPDEDGSGVDEELRGEVGIDKGFEDFQQRKADRYIGKLAGDEEYLDSSDVGSDDSKDELDSQAEIGVDLPARR
ncbi:hypothetical protein HAX54_048492 [Datura stramonium]|uniref:Uncharacterized protein n=1 Tax=Datura stramonium TaxID=4076 RepID=A0ABS8SUD3_DATST|nr:hypothetical protein [Datura stramonium]